MYSVLTLIWVAVIVVNQRPQLLHTRTVLRACRLESETFTFNITTKCMSLKSHSRTEVSFYLGNNSRLCFCGKTVAKHLLFLVLLHHLRCKVRLEFPIPQWSKRCVKAINIVGEHYLHDAWRLHLLLARQRRRGCCCGGLQSGQLLTLSVAIVHFSKC